MAKRSQTTPPPDPLIGQVIDGWTVVKKLGNGGHGDVYKGQGDTGSVCAIKVERQLASEATGRKKAVKVLHEYNLYTDTLSDAMGVPRALSYVHHENRDHMLIMELLRHNLSDLVEAHGGLLPHDVVMRLTKAALCCLRELHQRDVIHRDVKPTNVMLSKRREGEGGEHELFFVDMGIAIKKADRRRVTAATRRERRRSGRLNGTVLFASINAHRGHEAAERDDVESLVYTMIFLATRTLPWMHVKNENKAQRNNTVYRIKRDTQLEHICEGCPPCLLRLLRLARGMKYAQTPDYAQLCDDIQADMDALESPVTSCSAPS